MTTQTELLDRPTRRSIVLGAVVMFIVNALLFWLPFLGPLIAGFVGGRLSGGVIEALIAAILPSLLIGALLFVLGGAITGIALIGFIAGAGGLTLALSNLGLLLVGALIGGLIAE